VQVAAAAPAVRAHLPWRLQLQEMEKRAVIVTDPTGKDLAKVVRVACSREAGDIVFEAAAPGEYAVYYLPYRPHLMCGAYRGDYLPYTESAKPEWRQANGLAAEALRAGNWKTLPEAKLIELQARSEFDRLDPMEVIATVDEVAAIKVAHPQPLLISPRCAVPMGRRSRLRRCRRRGLAARSAARTRRPTGTCAGTCSRSFTITPTSAAPSAVLWRPTSAIAT